MPRARGPALRGYDNSRRAAPQAATRARLLIEAKRLFAAHGWEGVSVRAICKSLGVTTGAAFGSFSSKADLYTQAMGEPPPDLRGWLQSVSRAHLHPGDAWDAYCTLRSDVIAMLRKLYGEGG